MNDEQKRAIEEKRQAIAALSPPARVLIRKLAGGEIFDERTIMHAWRWIKEHGIRDEVLPAHYALKFLVAGGSDAAQREIEDIRSLDAETGKMIDEVLQEIENAMTRMQIARGEVLRQLHARSGGQVS